MKYVLSLAAACVIAAGSTSSAVAAPIGNGTVSVANLYSPSVDLSSLPATYTAVFGSTFEILGTGAFASVTGLSGVQNGTLQFSNIVGTVIDQNVANYFTFADGVGGNYSFSATSVTTRTFNVTPGVTSSISLFLLGNTSNIARGFDATPTSLTMSLNSTGASGFSSSSTLAIPPVVAAVPEPATWAMMLIGFGMVGGAARYRRRSTKAAFV
ncbi:PEPxxWA-CTERM sorting domain-containing protein [Sphingomonas mollis]|nr:PEPxxWA-CTERM sorting domain-containing protein [Sphingomonas sp. BT553]